jgi:hypothetical protein
LSATGTGEIIDAVTALIAAVGVGIGLYTFRHNSQESKELKRKEVLADIVLPLFNEFYNSPEIKIAKDILDDKPVVLVERHDKYPTGKIGYEELDNTLKYVPPESPSKFTSEEVRVRDSFQALLYLFCKLDYLVAQQIMKKDKKTDDIEIFRYYIDRVANISTIPDAVRKYKYPLYGHLNKKLNCGEDCRKKSN